MTDKAKKVLAGYSSLSDVDRAEVQAKINEFETAGPYSRVDLRESFHKTAGLTLGPLATGCPCCGR